MLRYLLFLIGLTALNSCNYDPAGELSMETRTLAAVTAISIDADGVAKVILADKADTTNIDLISNSPTSASMDTISLKPASNITYQAMQSGTYTSWLPDNAGTLADSLTSISIEKGKLYSIFFKQTDDSIIPSLLVDNLVTSKDKTGIRWILDSTIITEYTREIASYIENDSEDDEEEESDEENDNEQEDNYENKINITEESFYALELTDSTRTIRLRLTSTSSEKDQGAKQFSFFIDKDELKNNKNITIYTSRNKDGDFVHRYFIHPSAQ